MLRLTRDDLVYIAPRPKKSAAAAIWDSYVAALTSREASELFEKYQINTPLRIQHALATMVAETNLSLIWESGMYSAAGIVNTFGWNPKGGPLKRGAWRHSAKVTNAEAARIAALPVNADGSGPRCEALFERVYGTGNPKKAKELGNLKPGDGWRYRGALLNQLTGGDAHRHAAKIIGCAVENLVTPLNAVKVFLIEWDKKGCNKYADRDDPVSVRKLINGGSLKVPTSKINGLPNAVAALARAKRVITVADFDGHDDTPDVPTVADAKINENKPATLFQSSEMQASVMGTPATGTAASTQWMDVLPRAFGTATATGRFSTMAFVFALLSDPVFWAAASLTMATFGFLYLGIKRAKRFHIFGV